jgi:Glycosyl transferase family 2
MSEPIRTGRLRRKAYVAAPVPGVAAGRAARVSVIIPCYNYGRFLPDSVPSALSQESVEVEVVIVNDASTDDSAAVAAGYAAADPRVQVINHAANTGHVVAFNDGLAAATGEFIVRLDADDLLTPGSLARAVALFDRYPQVGLIYGHPNHFHGPVPEPRLAPAPTWTVWSGGDWVAERCRTGVNCITTPEAIIRGSVFREIGGLSTRLKFAQDMEVWLRAAAVSDVGRINGPDQALHREHPTSMSVTVGSGPLLDLMERRTVFEVLFAGPGGRLPDAALMLRTARRTLAAEALSFACRIYDRRRADVRDVDGYVEFALETFDGARELPQWRALALRRRLGARWSPVMPAFLPGGVVRKLRWRSQYRRWVRTGV